MRFRSALLALVVATTVPTAARAEPTPTDHASARREVFKSGMDDYAEGRYREAIGKWESIYRELEVEQSYRLAFNLARAWDKVGDPTRASEYFETYLREVERRHASDVVVDPLVEKQADDAKTRLAELKAQYARIQVGAGPRAVRIDRDEPRAAGSAGFVVYVTPGEHTIAFDPKTNEPKTVSVAAGEVVTVETPALDEPRVESPRSIAFRTVVDRPYSPVVPAIAGGVALLSLALPIALYGRANSLRDTYDDPTAERKTREQAGNDYESARTNAYVGAAVSIGLLAVAGGLTAWYFFGARERRVPIAVGRSSVDLGLRF